MISKASSFTRPTFLPDNWPMDTGFRLPAGLPNDLGLDHHKQSDDPWQRYLFVVARALGGDFSHGDTLLELVTQDPLDTVSELGALAGAILPVPHLRSLTPQIGGIDSDLMSDIVTTSGLVDLIAPMLSSRLDKELRILMLSTLLESFDTPEGAFEWFTVDALQAPVQQHVTRIQQQFPGVQHIFAGRPLHPSVFVAELRFLGARVVGEREWLWSSVSQCLTRIEWMTGMRFHERALRPHSDLEGEFEIDNLGLKSVILELEATDFSSYTHGSRVFYGHAVDG